MKSDYLDNFDRINQAILNDMGCADVLDYPAQDL
jgi:hypothetical protein